jgi:hypothetical protein
MIPLSFLSWLNLREFNQELRWGERLGDALLFQKSCNFSQDVGVCYPFARIIEPRGVDERHAAVAPVKVVIVSDLGCCRLDAMSNYNSFVFSESLNEL